MNSVHIMGRLVSDPDIRYTQDNLPIATFTVAIDRGKDKGTDFPRVQAFGKTAQLVEKYTEKGKRVAVEGSIRTGSYEKNGEKVYTTDVNAYRVEFIDWKDNDTASAKQSDQKAYESMGFEAIEDEDLPF